MPTAGPRPGIAPMMTPETAPTASAMSTPSWLTCSNPARRCSMAAATGIGAQSCAGRRAGIRRSPRPETRCRGRSGMRRSRAKVSSRQNADGAPAAQAQPPAADLGEQEGRQQIAELVNEPDVNHEVDREFEQERGFAQLRRRRRKLQTAMSTAEQREQAGREQQAGRNRQNDERDGGRQRRLGRPQLVRRRRFRLPRESARAGPCRRRRTPPPARRLRFRRHRGCPVLPAQVGRPREPPRSSGVPRDRMRYRTRSCVPWATWI